MRIRHLSIFSVCDTKTLLIFITYLVRRQLAREEPNLSLTLFGTIFLRREDDRKPLAQVANCYQPNVAAVMATVHDFETSLFTVSRNGGVRIETGQSLHTSTQ